MKPFYIVIIALAVLLIFESVMFISSAIQDSRQISDNQAVIQSQTAELTACQSELQTAQENVKRYNDLFNAAGKQIENYKQGFEQCNCPSK